jgi:hypothetical protein
VAWAWACCEAVVTKCVRGCHEDDAVCRGQEGEERDLYMQSGAAGAKPHRARQTRSGSGPATILHHWYTSLFSNFLLQPPGHSRPSRANQSCSFSTQMMPKSSLRILGLLSRPIQLFHLHYLQPTSETFASITGVKGVPSVFESPFLSSSFACGV